MSRKGLNWLYSGTERDMWGVWWWRYKDKEFMPDIDDGKSRSCIDERLKDSVEKVQFTKSDKIQEETDEWEEMLKM